MGGGTPALPDAATQHIARAALIVTGLGVMMLTLDSTIVMVALPAIQSTFDSTLGTLQLILVLYIIAQATPLLIVGYLSDRYGRRRIFQYGMIAFGISSLVCGLAPSIDALIVTRVFQGLASGILLAGGVALLNTATPADQRPRAFGIWGALFGIGVAIGPILGGVITSLTTWRWIFELNVPVAVAAVVVSWWISEEPSAGVTAPLDVRGLGLFLAAILTLLSAVELGPVVGWFHPLVGALGAASLGCFLAFVAQERRLNEPLFDLALLLRRGFLLGILGAVIISSTFWIAFLYFPLYFERAEGYSALASGLVLLSIVVPFSCVAVWGGTLSSRVSVSTKFALGFAVVALGMLWLAAASASAGWSPFLGGFVLLGAGTGLYQAEIARVAIAAAPERRAGVASGMIFTIWDSALSLIWSGLAAVFSVTVASSFASQVSGTGLDIPGTTGAVAVEVAVGDFGDGWEVLLAHGVPPDLHSFYLSVAQAAFFHGLQLVVVIGAGVALVAALLALALRVPRAEATSTINQPRESNVEVATEGGRSGGRQNRMSHYDSRPATGAGSRGPHSPVHEHS